MSNKQELYGLNVGRVNCVGAGDAGYRLENKDWETLTLRNARLRALKDPRVGMDSLGNYVWTDEYVRGLFNYVPNDDVIPSITFNRTSIENLVAFLLETEPAHSR